MIATLQEGQHIGTDSTRYIFLVAEWGIMHTHNGRRQWGPRISTKHIHLKIS